MSNGIRQLRKLLQQEGRVTATVIEIGQGNLKVSTPSGIKLVKNTSATLFKIDDSVIIEGNQLIGKVSSTKVLPVYYV